jgi:hypothetical protein
MRPLLWLSLLPVLIACDAPSRAKHPSLVSVAVRARRSREEATPTPNSANALEKEVSPARSPEGLAVLLAEYDRRVASGADVTSLAEAKQTIDRTAGQRDASVSRLFWYTDLESAKAAARKSGRPILSLRLLGRLDEELSCANSRLFRLTLYANAHVSAFLRDNYVLYWSSERPVPEVTIDFGDGRALKRTLTGNSVHYVLDAEGRVIDALPGLYGPAGFERGLRESLEMARRSSGLSDEDSATEVAKYHGRAARALTKSWTKQLWRVYGKDYGAELTDVSLPSPVKTSWPHPLYGSIPATVVNELTMSKADLEAPSLSLFQPEVMVSSAWGDWSKIAAGLPKEQLDDASVVLIRAKHPRDWSTRGATELDDAQLTKQLSQFESRLTEEELRNEFVFHGAVHRQLSKASRVDRTSLNEFVYSRLFMTPKGDAWLGLTSTTALTGIDDDGLVASAPAAPKTEAAAP